MHFHGFNRRISERKVLRRAITTFIALVNNRAVSRTKKDAITQSVLDAANDAVRVWIATWLSLTGSTKDLFTSFDIDPAMIHAIDSRWWLIPPSCEQIRDTIDDQQVKRIGNVF
ncbi:hypothetical protein TWF694_011212 [Orbilia ellipsospora]|uniref:Uncharacterized protein n=1 Tax=Orbilia ellipsospora TaxID=2528407 RepID=A0AAV9XB08_9PEZI